MEAHDVTKEGVKEKFPTNEVLEKWHNGEDAEWPPLEDEQEQQLNEEEQPQPQPQLPKLRFTVGTKVVCRIGPDAVKDWAPGTIAQLWYSDPKWPSGTGVAPYKVHLDDGRKIFAPADMDQVIRKVVNNMDVPHLIPMNQMNQKMADLAI